MRIKTYTAPTMNEAMDRVRKDLGSEAVIVSTLESEDEVRVTAALEEEEGMLAEDLSSLPSDRVPGLELICERLEKHNTPMELSESIIANCSAQPSGDVAERLIQSLGTTFRFAPMPTFETDAIPTMLVGPPGVGKTITIARLACQSSRTGKAIHVITADAQKAGAISQITSFAKALSLSVSVAHTPEELTQAIKEAPGGAPLLIDTPGINPFNQEELDRLAKIILSVRVAPVLTLPAGGDHIEQQEMIEAFATLGASRLILTKIDFSRRLGGLLAAVHKTRIQMMAYGNSPLVAHPLNPLGPQELALLLLDDAAKQAPDLAA